MTANNPFLPDNYEVPVVDGNYTKLKEGENRIRILSTAILGWELWIDKKPKRFKEDEDISVEIYDSADIDPRTGEPKVAMHFMAFVVWNYDAKPKAKIQIGEFKQKKIKTGINALNRSKSWGNPIGTDGYDILITRTKTGPSAMDVEYSVMPSPKEKLDKEILDTYKKANVDLEALYRGDDPFESESEEKVDMDEVAKKI